MDHGKLLALDTPEGLKRSVGADTVVKVSADGAADLSALATHLDTMEGATDSTVVDHTVQVSFRGIRGVLPRIVDHAERGGYTLTDLSVTEPTLETVFISLTGKDLRE
jgi:ABC-2 type transport system ATP-binding protein